MSQLSKKDLPPLEAGYSRSWYLCHCGAEMYSDYVPYSLSNPIVTTPCGHDFRQMKEIPTPAWAMTQTTEFTFEDVEIYSGVKERLWRRAQEVLRQKLTIENGKESNIFVDDDDTVEIDMNQVSISITFPSGCNCCSDTVEWFHFPLDWLYTDNWQEVYAQTVADKKAEEQRAEEAKIEAKRLAQEERERQEFERLKLKFEADAPGDDQEAI